MNNAWDMMRAALAESRATQHAADQHAAQMATLLRGRLRHAHDWDLAALKKELRGFNIHTKKWAK